MRVWATRTGQVQQVLRVSSYPVSNLTVSPDGRWLVACQPDDGVRLWEAESGREVRRLGETSGSPGQVRMPFLAPRVAFAPDSARLALARQDGTLELVDAVSGETQQSLQDEPGMVAQLLWSADGRNLAVLRSVMSADQATLSLWDVQDGTRLERREFETRAADMAFTPDGKALVVAAGRSLLLLDLAGLAEIGRMDGHEERITALDFAPDGVRLVSGATDGTLRVWDLRTREGLAILRAGGPEITDLQFHPDGNQLAVAQVDWSVILWDTAPSAQRVAAAAAARAERAACLELLDGLFAGFDDPEQVVERLRNDPGVDLERLRHAAVLARLVATDARTAFREGWRLVRTPGASTEDLHLTLWSAQIAARTRANADSFLLLGAARYRLGDPAGALEALERADGLRGRRGRVEVLAFLALAAERSGDQARADAALAEVQGLMQIPSNLIQLDRQQLQRECEELLLRRRR